MPRALHVLPPSLLESLEEKYGDLYKKSNIHSPFGRSVRLACLDALHFDHGADIWHDHDKIPLPKTYTPISGGREYYEDGSTWLHLYARGDIAGVYDLIRLAHPLDAKDLAGGTPLLAACCALYQYAFAKAESRARPLFATEKRSLAAIVRLLVLHHADVNATVNEGWSAILWRRLAHAEEWELCELLLQHGADPAFVRDQPSSMALSERRRQKMDYLIRLHYSTSRPRPPRLCPCHSDLALDDCHNSADARHGRVPWPSYAPCPCLSKLRDGHKSKPYSECCESRGVRFVSYWKDWRIVDDTLQRTGNVSGLRDFVDPETFEKLETYTRSPSYLSRVGRSEHSKEEYRAVVLPVVERLAFRNALDPAFAYVIRRVGHNLRPHANKGPKYSKADLLMVVKCWNDVADEYIATGVDQRCRRDIEIACKLNSVCGPMYRRCEADTCENREVLENEFKQCGKCKKTVYCSTACQVASWKSHKKECCTDNQTAQWLPDSITTHKELTNEACTRLEQDLRNLELFNTAGREDAR